MTGPSRPVPIGLPSTRPDRDHPGRRAVRNTSSATYDRSSGSAPPVTAETGCRGQSGDCHGDPGPPGSHRLRGDQPVLHDEDGPVGAAEDRTPSEQYRIASRHPARSAATLAATTPGTAERSVRGFVADRRDRVMTSSPASYSSRGYRTTSSAMTITAGSHFRGSRPSVPGPRVTTTRTYPSDPAVRLQRRLDGGRQFVAGDAGSSARAASAESYSRSRCSRSLNTRPS